jgi:transcriptional regulator
MYLPTQFDAQDRAMARDLIHAHPLASLVSNDDDGQPFVSHIPLHLVEGEPAAGAGWSLLGHVAKGNPHWQHLQSRPAALVTFMGPQAFMSTRVYPDLVRVPTWNYLAVHCTVQSRLIEAQEDKDRLLKTLIADHDPAYAAQWRGLGEDYARRMLSSIVAFELRITKLQCKIKLNQHRPESHAAMHALYAAGDADERALAQWMERLGLMEAAKSAGGAT